jgi:lycopene cyclase domain-containing protein
LKTVTYLLIMLFSLAGPLALSFDGRVNFYKKWKFALQAGIIVAIPFVVWDSLFTKHSFWGFNSERILGVKFFDLPIEEISFFIIIPFCCVFIAELLSFFNYQFPGKFWDKLSLLIGIGLFCIGIRFFDQWYTLLSFGLGGLSILVLFFMKAINWNRFWLLYLIHLIPFLVVNGFLTYYPVVWYNNAENLGIRIGTIPIEDTSYSLIALSWNVYLYELFKRKKPSEKI